MSNAVPSTGIPRSRETLLQASKEELADLLLLAFEAMDLANSNMAEMKKLVEEAMQRAKDVEDKLASQEAELILLRNTPK